MLVNIWYEVAIQIVDTIVDFTILFNFDHDSINSSYSVHNNALRYVTYYIKPAEHIKNYNNSNSDKWIAQLWSE